MCMTRMEPSESFKCSMIRKVLSEQSAIIGVARKNYFHDRISEIGWSNRSAQVTPRYYKKIGDTFYSPTIVYIHRE